MKGHDKNKCRGHIQNIDIAFGKLMKYSDKYKTVSDVDVKDAFITSIAVNIENIYTGLEKIFEAVLKDKAIKLEKTEYWHKKLLSALEEHGVFYQELIEKLDMYRSFRHLSRHTYTHLFEPKEVLSMANEIVSVYPEVKNKILEYLGK